MNDVAEAPRVQTSADEPVVEPSSRPRTSRRKIVRLAIVGVVLAALIAGGVAYWLHGRGFASTDNAYVNANTVDVAAQVVGQVVEVYVRDQQRVAAGAPLFDIDPRNYEAALAKAEAQLALARQSEQQQQAAVSVARAQLAQRQAEEVNARHNEARTQQLVASGFYSKQGGEAARRTAPNATSRTAPRICFMMTAPRSDRPHPCCRRTNRSRARAAAALRASHSPSASRRSL